MRRKEQVCLFPTKLRTSQILRVITLIIWMCIGRIVYAQDTDYPTMDALNAVTLPPNDPIDLARRLRGITIDYQVPTSAPIYNIGDSKAFSVANTSAQQEQIKTATLRGMSDNVLLWVEADVEIAPAMAEQFVNIVDMAIVQQVQDLWGIVEPAGIDGDTRLYILMVTGLDTSIGGYFSDVHAYPRGVVPNSNQHEMMVINLSAFSNNDILSTNMLTIIAHEYQHVLRHFIDNNEATWLDEGFSMYTEHHIGWDYGRSQVVGFLNHSDVQINHWVDDTRKFERYGGAFLLVNYFAERYGLSALRQWSDEPLDSFAGLDAVLQRIDGSRADEFFADWALANYFRDPATGYGYSTLDRELPSARPLNSIIDYPFETTRRTVQYSTDYFTAFRFGDVQTMTLTLTQPETVGLIPASVFEGEHMMYAIAADYSDLTLTREFDLSGVDSATLSYRTWYDLEEFWDYAYVLVSRDDGATWDILPATTTRDNNPYYRGYGVGYTGQSFGWVQEHVSLDAYVGEKILLRFEVITDAASIRDSIAIDDLRIDAIGYADGFEDDVSAWDAQGWILTDNHVPQEAWVQAVQVIGQDVTVSRWLADTPSQSWTIDLLDNVEMLLVAVSPIAYQTMVNADYTLYVGLDTGLE